MFGLMRPRKQCSISYQKETSYLLHRQHYCGTCKVIGQTFDHKSRLLLNFDTVFLAELLSELDSDVTTNWEPNLQSINTCLILPQEKTFPFSLEYAAHSSALLGALKVDDNIKDSGRFYWRMIRQAYQKTFKKAYQQFSTWGLDTGAIEQCILQQVHLEKEAVIFSEDISSHLLHYAYPTAQITSALFSLGGQLLEKTADLEALGLAFGQLMYVLDAFEDYEQDVFKGEFNPLAVYGHQLSTLPPSTLEEVRQLLLELEQTIITQIQQLPLSEITKERFSARLSANLALRLYRERIVPKTIKERLILRWEKAKTTAEEVTCHPTGWAKQMNFYMIAVAVFINPEAQSYLPEEGKWEIFQWGLIFTTFLATLGLVPIIRKSRKQKRKERRERRRQRRLQRKAQQLSPFGMYNSCWSDCCGECCSGCCQSCVDSGCCEEACEEEDACIIITLIFLGLCLLVGLVILILFLAGVL